MKSINHRKYNIKKINVRFTYENSFIFFIFHFLFYEKTHFDFFL